MKNRATSGYNERLFSSGLRRKFHLARFAWLSQSVTKRGLPHTSVIELGCFDGKTIEYLPHKPTRYLGLDANWEDGLTLARQRWQHEPAFEFRACHTPDEMRLRGEQFDLAICMDTFEHIPPALVDPYLQALAEATRTCLMISVPNEQGAVFCVKYLLKMLLRGDRQAYTRREFVAAAFGRMERIARCEHKGFAYARLIAQVARYFTLDDVTGYPFPRWPLALNFGVGITAGKKHDDPDRSAQ